MAFHPFKEIDLPDRLGATAGSYYTLTLRPDLVDSYYKWTASGSGTNEYYCELATGGNPGLTQPKSLKLGGELAPMGEPGSLEPGEWAWGDNDSLGYSTVYVRLSDGADPDSKSAGFVAYTDYFPSSAKYLAFKLINTHSTSYAVYTVTPLGTTGDTTNRRIEPNHQCLMLVQLNNTNRQVTVYCDIPSYCRLYVVGYGDVDSFVNGPNTLTPGTGWYTFDLTPYVPGSVDPAGAFFRVMQRGDDTSLAHHDEASPIVWEGKLNHWIGAACGVQDDTDEVKLYGGLTVSKYNLYGFFDKTEWAFNITHPEIGDVATYPDTGKWYGIPTGKPGAKAVIVQVFNDASGDKQGCVRGFGASDNHQTHAFINGAGANYYVAACDELGQVEIYRQHTDVKFYLAGWALGTVEKSGYDFACGLDDGELTRQQGGTADAATLSDSALLAVARTASLPAYAGGVDGGTGQQPAWLRGLGQASVSQPSHAGGYQGLTAQEQAFLKGSAGTSAAQLAYLEGQAGSLRVEQPAFLAGGAPILGALPGHTHGIEEAAAQQVVYINAERLYGEAAQPASAWGLASLPGSQPAQAVGMQQLLGSKAAYLRAVLGAAGSQPAYLEGFSNLVVASQPACAAGWGVAASSVKACAVAALPAGRIAFQLGSQQLLLQARRIYPVRQPAERLQVVSRTAAGTLRVMDKGVGVRLIRLAFAALTGADHAALLSWFETVAVGALNPFTLVDETGASHQVRWMGGLDLEQTALGRWRGEVVLEKVG